MDTALSVLRQLTSSPRDVEHPMANDPSVLRAEAYAYHRESAAKTPELFQPETLKRIRGGAEIDTVAYVHARRQLDQLRRSTTRIFDTVDLLVTPTTPVPPFTISELLANPDDLRAKEIITLRNTRPFNMWACRRSLFPAVSLRRDCRSACRSRVLPEMKQRSFAWRMPTRERPTGTLADRRPFLINPRAP